MITKQISRSLLRWQSYNISIGTEISDNEVIQANNLYNIEVFKYQYTDYTPHTYTNGLIYSGNIYLQSTTDVCDLCDFIRDSLEYNLFPSNNTILQQYHIGDADSGLYEFPLLSGDKTDWTQNNKFYIYITSSSTSSTLEVTITLYPSFDPEGSTQLAASLSDPILDIVSPGQMIPITRSSTIPASFYSIWNLSFRTTSGTTVNVSREGSILSGIFGIANMNLHLPTLIPNRNDLTGVFNLSYWAGSAIQITQTLRIDPCIKYVLYYRNLKGGWDWLVVRGLVKKSYKFKSNSYTNDYLLGTSRNFNIRKTTGTQLISSDVNNLSNEVIYNNQITTSLTLNLGWFTDAQSQKLINLFTSPLVFIHDILKANILPLKITEKSLDEKQYVDGKSIKKYTLKADINHKYII